MTGRHRTAAWILDHPWQTLGLFMLGGFGGAAVGLVVAWLLGEAGVVARDSRPAGLTLGIGLAMAGVLAVGLLLGGAHKGGEDE